MPSKQRLQSGVRDPYLRHIGSKKKGKEAYRLPWSLGPFLLSAISAICSIKKDIDEIVCMHIEDAFHHQRS